MTLMIRIEMKNYNMILTEKQQEHLRYHQVKLINMNILQVKKHYHLVRVGLQNSLSFLNLLLEKALETQTKAINYAAEKQTKTIKGRVQK